MFLRAVHDETRHELKKIQRPNTRTMRSHVHAKPTLDKKSHHSEKFKGQKNRKCHFRVYNTSKAKQQKKNRTYNAINICQL